MPDLLIELFSEEIPARMQAKAAADLQKLVTDGLVEAGLTYAGAGAFSTPRRLALSVEGLTGESPDTREERKGPKVGAPDGAIDGFCRGAGVSRDALEVRNTGKGEVYFAVIEKPGRKAGEIIAEVLEGAIRTFPWPKSMRWGTGELKWVRPLHSILCILSDEAGADVVPLDVDGIVSGDVTKGHRFHAPEAFSVASFEDYEAKLKRAKVILRADERADMIWSEASNQAFAAGLELVEDKGLLAEVAGLVEWPVVLMGTIADDFLSLPPEVLTASMKEHQKFFSVKDKTGQVVRFVTVANRETADNGATILAGNQKVLFARLSDAKFFWENDLRTVKAVGLEGMAKPLAEVTFHNKLGSQAERIARIAALAREIAPLVGADADLAEQAARVAKADLRSEMVGEFPELQGLMGSYYAREAGLPEDVARACLEHYQPLGPSDSVPSSPVSVAVALADKIDTLTGFWAIDEKPTGSKDPFALRRAALGVIRLVLGNRLKIGLEQISGGWLLIAAKAYQSFGLTIVFPKLEGSNFGFGPDYPIERDFEEIGEQVGFLKSDQVEEHSIELADIVLDVSSKWCPDLLAFFHDRLKVYLRDEGIRHDVIDACLAMPGNDDLTLLVKRAEALSAFLKTDDGENLIQGFKRANNLWSDEMKKGEFLDDESFLNAIRIVDEAEEKDGVEYSFGADVKFAETDEERALFKALDEADAKIAPAMAAEDFAAAMSAMADLRAPIDAFFEAVQINAESEILRRNRLNLLHRIRTICLSVADLRKLEG